MLIGARARNQHDDEEEALLERVEIEVFDQKDARDGEDGSIHNGSNERSKGMPRLDVISH